MLVIARGHAARDPSLFQVVGTGLVGGEREAGGEERGCVAVPAARRVRASGWWVARRRRGLRVVVEAGCGRAVSGCESGLDCCGDGVESAWDVVILFARLSARLGECQGAGWIHKRRGTGRVIRWERRFVAVALRG